MEVPRTMFTQFGFYLGDNKVAHPTSFPCLQTTRRSLVLCATVRAQAFPNEDVGRRAEKLVGAARTVCCGTTVNTVTYCKYGSATSRQTEFCTSLKSVIRDQRSVTFTGVLGVISVICFGMAPSTTLPTVLIPFALWMAG
uniref:Lecithin retinol acyltransferase n=1 Tax=Mastacembelus armatus TaxID=205130 RepID=A0A7N8Y1M3_9TELE